MGFVVPRNVVVIVNRPQSVRVDYFTAEFATNARNAKQSGLRWINFQSVNTECILDKFINLNV